MILLLLTILIVSLITYMIKYNVKNIEQYKKARTVPGPPRLPIIGNSHLFFGSLKEVSQKCKELTNTYSSPFRIWFENNLVYVAYEPEHIKKILCSSTSLDKGEIMGYFREWFGNGIFTASGTKWRMTRKHLTPTLSPQIMEIFIKVIISKSQILLNEMENELNKGDFDILNYIAPYSTDVIIETAMGIPSNTQVTKDWSLLHNIKRILQITLIRMMNIFLHPDIIFRHSKYGKEFRYLLDYLSKHSNEVMRKKKELNEAKRKSGEANIENNTERNKTPFLDQFLSLSGENKQTDEDLLYQITTMVAGGAETTTTTMYMTLLMLASHPEIQKKAYDEQFEIYGDEDPISKPNNLQDLRRMTYLDQVLKETMRLFPALPITIRYISEDLNLGEYTLAKGSHAVVSIVMVQRLEKYWKNPFKFDPDRFTPEEIAKRPSYTFIPYSAGPRNCLGTLYAMTSMKVVLSSILRKYVLKTESTFKIEDLDLIETFHDTKKLYKFRIEKRYD